MGKQWQTLFWGAPKSLQMVTAAMKLKDAYFLEEKLWPNYIAYSKAETLLCRLRSVSSRLWFFQWSCMDVKVGLWRKLSTEELMLLNCGVGEDSWESLGLKEIQPVHSKEDQSWVFFGRTDAKAETPVLWPPYTKSWLFGKASDAGKDWGQEEKGTTEDGWHHWWTWVWVNSGSWWWTGRPGMLQFMGWQKVGQDWETELNWT